MKILLVNQSFYPDTIATSRYLIDLALDLISHGHEVTVVTGNHGYDDTSQRFSMKENYQGIHIHRIPYTSFGKKTRLTRAMDFASFFVALFFRLLTLHMKLSL